MQVRCRKCGAGFVLPDYHGATRIECPHCRWCETIPARKHLPKKLDHQAGTAFQAHQHEEELIATVIERLHELSPAGFERFCAGMFELLGHTIAPVDQARDQSHAFELRDGDEVTYVGCHRCVGHEPVGEEAIDDLAGSMRHDGVTRAIYVTCGTFDDTCIERAKTAGIELLDRDGLHRRLESVDVRELVIAPEA